MGAILCLLCCVALKFMGAMLWSVVAIGRYWALWLAVFRFAVVCMRWCVVALLCYSI